MIKRVISGLLHKEIKDPRIGFVTITGAELSRDFSHARVGISILGTDEDIKKSMAGLESAHGFIQYRVGKALGIRVMPKIEFFLDTSLAESVDIVNLINRLVPQSEDAESENKAGDNGANE